MKVDNAAKILTMLKFENPLDFYYINIIKRRKDNLDMKKGEIHVVEFFIDSIEDFKKKYPLIQHICILENARAYITINRRSYKKISVELLRTLSHMFLDDSFKRLKGCTSSIINKFSSEPDKKWLIDVDFKDLDEQFNFDVMLNFLNTEQRKTGKEPFCEILPTKNGTHIITRPFNAKNFKEKYQKITIHKDALTLLFCNENPFIDLL